MEDVKMPLSERVSKFVKDNLATMIIVLISIVYVFSGIAQIEKTGKTITEIIAGSIINLVVGLSIKALMRENGIKSGQRDSRYLATLKTYGTKLDNNTSNIPSLDDYCDYKNSKNFKKKQISYLRQYGLDYESFLNHKYDKDYPEICHKCRNLKIHPISTLVMLNAVNIIDAEENLIKKNIKSFKAQSTIKNTIVSVLCAFLFAYYTLGKGTFDPLGMLWAGLQIIIHLTLGTIEYFSASSFITNDLRSKLILIIACFDEFETMLKNGYFKKGVEDAITNENVEHKESNNSSGINIPS